MELKGNKGEWSELYAFLKLLADGKLYCGDGYLNRYDERFYPILKVFRDDAADRIAYEINASKNNILVAGDSINIEISRDRFEKAASDLLNLIVNIGKNTDFADILPFISEIGCRQIKAKSSDKADIRLVIHNLTTGSKPELGYSIKSRLGADSTLINSNKDGTNFIYKIEGISHSHISTFNSFTKFKDKFSYLREIGGNCRFLNVANNTLHCNLTMLDIGLERIIAESLLRYYRGDGRMISEITDYISAEDPLELGAGNSMPMYAYKMKQFLLAFALGMTSSTPWNGKFNANGGYIVVKENGDLVCYHFFDRNDLEDYLFSNTRFETPSTSRHNFGSIYMENEDFFLKLNLQIRFR